jgi:hypothetical protein
MYILKPTAPIDSFRFLNGSRKQKNLLKEQLIEHDNAFLNSLLSYGVYTRNKWSLDLIKNSNKIMANHAVNINSDLHTPQPLKTTAQQAIDKITAHALEDSYSNQLISDRLVSDNGDLTLKDSYDIYIADYIRHTFELVDLPNLKSHSYTSEKYGYTTDVQFNNGDYKSLNNLANAGVFKSLNADGTFTLHLAFRGTDKEARNMFDYVTKAYADMSSYYDAFKPLEKAILEYAKDPKNNISNLHVTGHSLGGTMVQEFFASEDTKNSGLNIKGYTYGAPGNRKQAWNGVAPALYHAIKHGKFKQLGQAILDGILNNYQPENPNISQYTHRGDLIPLAGALGYKSSGHSIEINDIASKNINDSRMLDNYTNISTQHKKPQFSKFKLLVKAHEIFIEKPIIVIKKAITFEYHDMLRYVQNVNHHVDSILTKNKDLSCLNLTPRIEEFIIYKNKYQKSMTGSYDAITEHMIKERKIPKAPPSMQGLTDRMLAYRRKNSILQDITHGTAITPKLT